MLARLLLPRALRKGFLGGSRLWTVLGSLVIAMRVLKKVTASKPEVAYCAALEPGQTILISHERDVRVVRRRR